MKWREDGGREGRSVGGGQIINFGGQFCCHSDLNFEQRPGRAPDDL